jgi:pilus assembly protein FimV
VHLLKIKKLSIALGLTLLPVSVLAAGLGQLNMASGIGEPLRAEIELLSVSPAEKASLKAKIAPESAYTAQGLERPASHQDIQVQIAKNATGKDVLKLRSSQPIDEPFLDMLVEVEWETGRILREYTVLLDPPGYKNQAAAIETPAIKATNNTKATATQAVPSNKTDSATTSTTTSTQVSALPEDYLTKQGDTLSKIARRMKPEGVSLDQMLIGLFEANPEAFDGNNMNRLKVGKILQPPTQESLDAISRKEAVNEIKLQTANWNEYRNKLAGMVDNTAPLASEDDSQSSSGKIKPATEDQSAEQSAGPKDVVKLSSGDARAVEADMQAKITALQEEVSAREKGLKDAQDRIGALEKQIEDMQKLLTLRNDALADAQDASKQESVADVQDTQSEQTEVEQSPPVVRLGTKLEGAEEVKQADQASAAKPVPAVENAKPVQQPAPPVEQPSFVASSIESITNIFKDFNTTILGAVGALLAILIGAWLYLRNKRRKNLADFEQGIMTSGGLKANTVFGNTSGASVDTGDTSFLTDFSQSTSGGMIDTNDVDPIAEAEVYMAYGRDAQAEEILKDAISKEPKRYELHLKLLEMYAASKNMSAFETVSGELYTTLGADDPTWAKVAEIGIKLEPNNPLYQIKEGLAVAKDVSNPNDDADKKLDATDFDDSPLAGEADLDFSLSDESNEDEDNTYSAASLDDVPTITDDEAKVKSDDIDEEHLDAPEADNTLDIDNSALEFDLSSNEETQSQNDRDLDKSLTEESFAHTMPNLDFPSLDIDSSALNLSGSEEDEALETESGDDSELVNNDTESSLTLEVPNDLSLDIAEPDQQADNLEDAVQSEDSDVATEPESFGFDIDTITEDTITFEADADTPEVSEEINMLDMSDISLDVEETVGGAIAEVEVETDTSDSVSEANDEPESEEVETKLELVAAYIDMEDKEGAKELLDEVLKEGGTKQRMRAEEILATLS